MVFTYLKKNIFLQKKLKNNLLTRPTILIFDSGLGGLSIYREIKKNLPNSHYIYVFDNEAFPYGKKNKKFIINRVYKIINAVAKKHILTTAVIACNTASTICLKKLRNNFSFPIIGVVPAIKPATKTTRNGIICLLATTGTIKSEYTNKLINRFAINCKITPIISDSLVKIAEKKICGEKLYLNEINKIIKQCTTMKKNPDTIILGCTHFPLLINELKKEFPYGIKFIDSSLAISKRIMHIINKKIDTNFSDENNLAYCSIVNKNSQKLSYILKKEGFLSLKQLFF